MEKRDLDILRHVARHGLSTKDIIQKVFFGDTSSSTVFTRLLKEKRLLTSEGRMLPGGRVYYQLTADGLAAVAQYESSRGKARRSYVVDPLSGQQLLDRLAALWVCNWDPNQRRLLLQAEDLAELLESSDAPRGLHCIQGSDQRFAVLRIYVPGPVTEPTRVREQVAQIAAGLLEHDAAKKWVVTRNYGILVLVHDRDRQQAVRKVLFANGISEKVSLHLGIAPTPEVYDKAVKS
jgi:DNA-binding PadR family transcriptional regulator